MNFGTPSVGNIQSIAYNGITQAFTTPALEYGIAKAVIDMGGVYLEQAVASLTRPLLGAYAMVPVNLLQNMVTFGMIKSAGPSV